MSERSWTLEGSGLMSQVGPVGIGPTNVVDGPRLTPYESVEVVERSRLEGSERLVATLQGCRRDDQETLAGLRSRLEAAERERDEAIKERDIMRGANVTPEDAERPLGQSVEFWQDRALDYATHSDRQFIRIKELEREATQAHTRPAHEGEALLLARRALGAIAVETKRLYSARLRARSALDAIDQLASAPSHEEPARELSVEHWWCGDCGELDGPYRGAIEGPWRECGECGRRLEELVALETVRRPSGPVVSVDALLSDAAIDALRTSGIIGARVGCTCTWDEDGNPPASCRCTERGDQQEREACRQALRAAVAAVSGGEQ